MTTETSKAGSTESPQMLRDVVDEPVAWTADRLDDDAGLVKPEAWVVLVNGDERSDVLADEIQEQCKNNLAPYKYPRWINFTDDLPKTATGKIQRFKLRSD